MMSAYALYRLPHADSYTALEGSTQEFTSCVQLNGQSGFVVAPFEVRPDQPIVLIRPELVEERDFSRGTRYEVRGTRLPLVQQYTRINYPRTSHLAPRTSILDPRTSKNNYAIDFANFHAQLQQGTFRKIVLARCSEQQVQSPVDDKELFLRACQLYPRMFIALVHTPQSGTWLTATPEILLEGSGSDWRTIALAGTMKLEPEQLGGEGENVRWSTKNIEEQRIVATYIAECLERFTDDFREEGPRTVRAANLVHLRSDFTFKLASNDCIGDLLQALHPTPAVCGLPKRDAFQFIIRNEHTPRRYYSGFMGPLKTPSGSPCLGGEKASPKQGRLEGSTHLYVSLRCMNIESDRYRLYAGGGLLKDSTEEQEWLETEAKLETMRRCIAISKA